MPSFFVSLFIASSDKGWNFIHRLIKFYCELYRVYTVYTANVAAVSPLNLLSACAATALL